MMTNWQTISNSIRRLHELEKLLAGDELAGMTKKELLNMTRERDKLERALGGIKDMGGLPDILVVIDTNKEAIAVNEAGCLNIPVVGVIDSNSDPKGIAYPVPGNDDAIRAIDTYCELLSGAVLDGIQESMTDRGVDLGEAEEVPVEAAVEEVVVEEAAPEAVVAEAAVAEEAPAEAPKEA
jgi:small subunit ribosomal protein S2